MASKALRVEKPVYGGDGLARTAVGEVVMLPFVLPGELIEASGARDLRVLEASPDRVEAQCVHFGVCGGCQYQMARYPAQLAMKVQILTETLARAGVGDLPALEVYASPEPWGYRNRIRLQVRGVGEPLEVGYQRRGSREFLPVQMCPIAAPVLWEAAERFREFARREGAALAGVQELELACNAEADAVQMQLLVMDKRVRVEAKALKRLHEGLRTAGVPVRGLSATRVHAASGRSAEVLGSVGDEGMRYRVGETRFWLEPGSFFQVNRFLVPAMVQQVTGAREGALAWDLYAGVGLFARELAKRFARVTAVEANGVAARELRRGLRRAGDPCFEETTVAFLRRAVLERDRPELVVLDPPRAGAGEEVCALLARVRPKTLVYVSCDPVTLARDVRQLQLLGYGMKEVSLFDLFPQTYHLETVMVLQPQTVPG